MTSLSDQLKQVNEDCVSSAEHESLNESLVSTVDPPVPRTNDEDCYGDRGTAVFYDCNDQHADAPVVDLISRAYDAGNAVVCGSADAASESVDEIGIDMSMEYTGSDGLCLICLCNISTEEVFELSCGHRYCFDCIQGYFHHRVNDGEVNLRCFHPIDADCCHHHVDDDHLLLDLQGRGEVVKDHRHESTSQKGKAARNSSFEYENRQSSFPFFERGSTFRIRSNSVSQMLSVRVPHQAQVSNKCGRHICAKEIKHILDKAHLEKFSRFKALRDDPHARDCPRCLSVQSFDPKQPSVVCQGCNLEYCYFHADAHPGETCSDFIKRTDFHESANRQTIRRLCKTCPGCKMGVEKAGGCNHMKCVRCSTNFCWICSSRVDDTHFPAHYAWWNLAGCPARQMTSSDRQLGTLGELAVKAVVLCLILLIGPPAALLTLISLPLVAIVILMSNCIDAFRGFGLHIAPFHRLLLGIFTFFGYVVICLFFPLFYVFYWVAGMVSSWFISLICRLRRKPASELPEVTSQLDASIVEDQIAISVDCSPRAAEGGKDHQAD